MKDVEVLLNQGVENLSSAPEVLIERGDSFDAETLKNMIRDLGLKVTTQRLSILKALTRGRAHCTAQEVFERVSKDESDIGFATVYRFLKDLAEGGVVTEVRTLKQPTRYELTPKAHHDHLTCTKCGKIVEFHNEDIERLQELVARNEGFYLTGHVLELYGVCADCR